jgi:hypothetical protein
MSRYKGLSDKDKEYLAKFDKAFSGRAKKEVYDELGFPTKARKEHYNERYRHRQDKGFKPKVIRFRLNEQTTGSNPTDAIIEAIDIKREFELRIISPLRGERLKKH